MPNLDSIQPNPHTGEAQSANDETSIPIRRVLSETPEPPKAPEVTEETGDHEGEEATDDPFDAEVRRPIEEMNEHTVGFVFKQALFILFQPGASFEDLREERAIGRPMAVTIFLGVLLLLLQLVLFYATLSHFSGGNALLQYLFPPIDGFRPTQLVYAFAVLAVFWITQFIGVWALMVIITHFMARLFGGRGSWSIFAVSALYWMITTFFVIAPLSVVFSLIMNSAAGWWFVGIFLWLVGWVWIAFMLSRAVRVQYQLSIARSLLAVFLPPLVLFFGFMLTSVIVPPLDDSSGASSTPSQNTNAVVNGVGPVNAAANANTNINANLPLENTNININASSANTNAPIPIDEDSLPGFNRVNTTVLEELTEAKRKELAKVAEIGTDQVRAEQLVEMKYDLKLYYSIYQAYPASQGTEKLDGRTDSLNKALEDFYGTRRSFVDPQYPSYYYSYESDGQTFQLTGFNVTRQEPVTITEKD